MLFQSSLYIYINMYIWIHKILVIYSVGYIWMVPFRRSVYLSCLLGEHQTNVLADNKQSVYLLYREFATLLLVYISKGHHQKKVLAVWVNSTSLKRLGIVSPDYLATPLPC